MKVVGEGSWIQQCLNSFRDLFWDFVSLSFFPPLPFLLPHSFIHSQMFTEHLLWAQIQTR